MKHVSVLLLAFLLFFASRSYGQRDNVTFHFIDAATGGPVANVVVLDRNGTQVAKGNQEGYATISSGLFSASEYLLAIHNGYSVDTLHAVADTIVRMKHLEQNLEGVSIVTGRTSQLLHSTEEYVADYDFAGDKIIVATYSGSRGRHSKLFLLNSYGKILATTSLQNEALRIFKSCVGNLYYVSQYQFYPLVLDSDKITIRDPYNISFLKGMEECNVSLNGNLYYRKGDKPNFRMRYEVLKKGDSVARPMIAFEEDEAAQGSMDQYYQILAYLGYGDFSGAARVQLLRKMLDNACYSHINLPIMRKGTDSLFIFDYFQKKIRFYDLSGMQIGTASIRFEWRQSQQFEIIKDEASDKFYVHRYSNPDRQTVEQLDITTGQVAGAKIPVDKPFAEHLKVHNGLIYFLWQDSRAPATRQLFVQRMDNTSGEILSLKQ